MDYSIRRSFNRDTKFGHAKFTSCGKVINSSACQWHNIASSPPVTMESLCMATVQHH